MSVWRVFITQRFFYCTVKYTHIYLISYYICKTLKLWKCIQGNMLNCCFFVCVYNRTFLQMSSCLHPPICLCQIFKFLLEHVDVLSRSHRSLDRPHSLEHGGIYKTHGSKTKWTNLMCGRSSWMQTSSCRSYKYMNMTHHLAASGFRIGLSGWRSDSSCMVKAISLFYHIW